MINTRNKGESNTITLDVYSSDADRHTVHSVSSDIVMSRDGSSVNENSFSTATPIFIETIYNEEIDSTTDID